MSLIGVCSDCGRGAQLRYKPDVSIDQQSRPSVCARCRDLREELVMDHVREVEHRGLDLDYERH